MNKIVVITLSIMFLIVGTTLWAQEEEGHGRTADVILNEIKQVQGVTSITLIDPDLIRPALLEELGDAVMDLMIADEERHEWMDEMMGGEGSEQLASTHRWIAYNYLQNDGKLDTWGPGMGGYGFMGPGMMGSWNRNWNGSLNSPYNMWDYGPGSMMGWSGNWWSWIAIIVILVVIAVVVVALVRSRRSGPDSSSDVLEILRSRYAEGKITREEYQRMSKELKE
ncbi:MAG: hypothetical protein M0Q12_12930 [Synergistaceae bacterium]|nr:hypothetical protein [Synergistaceae bacterium]